MGSLLTKENIFPIIIKNQYYQKTMTFNELRKKVKDYPIFKLEDVLKWFPEAKRQTTLNQISFWEKKGWIESLKKGIYILKESEVREPFIVANFIYSPSYISLESGLNYYGIIPDIPFGVTSVTINKTNLFKTESFGTFYYHHIMPDLFFGYKTILVGRNYSYNIALPEKALFDYLYLKAKKVDSFEGFIEELRLSLPKDFNWKSFLKWQGLVSIRNKTFHQILKAFQEYYGQ